MEGIPSIYWMILIGVFTGFVCLVLYQLAMLLRESTKAVGDGRKVIQDIQGTVQVANEIVVEVKDMLGTLKVTLSEVNNAVLVPIKKIGLIVGVVSNFVEGVASRKE
jgi:hypothetical protein